MELSDGSYLHTSLDGLFEPQTIIFKYPVTASSITITIDDIFIGGKYEDTAITEIELF